MSSLHYHTESCSWFCGWGRFRLKAVIILQLIVWEHVMPMQISFGLISFGLSCWGSKKEWNWYNILLSCPSFIPVWVFCLFIFVCGLVVCICYLVCLVWFWIFGDCFQAICLSQMTWATQASQDLALDNFHGQCRVLCAH